MIDSILSRHRVMNRPVDLIIQTLFIYFQMKEFRQKIGNWLPSIPKNNPPQGRTEFSGINDLLRYIIQVDEETKSKKKKD